MKSILFIAMLFAGSVANAACPADLVDALYAKDLMVDHLNDHLNVDLNHADVEVPKHHVLSDTCDAWYTANYKRVTGSLHDYHCVYTGRVILFGYFYNQYSFSIQNQNLTCPSGYSTWYRVDGQWINRDMHTRYIKRVIFEYDTRRRIRRVRVLGKCGSGQCDWGYASVRRENGSYVAVFQNSRKRILNFDLTRDGKLELLAQEYTSGGGVPTIRQATFEKEVLNQ